MKKVIFPALLAVVSLVFFSFKPMHKTEGTVAKVTDSKILSLAKTCDRYDATNTTFTSCYTISTTTPVAPAQNRVLDKY
jgi:hypothetical protein